MIEPKKLLSDNTIKILITIVFVGVTGIVFIVFNHDKAKPKSPQELVAAAFNNLSVNNLNNIFTIKEWKPGMGPEPLLYHPAGFNNPVWKPLPPDLINNNSVNNNNNGITQQSNKWKAFY